MLLFVGFVIFSYANSQMFLARGGLDISQHHRLLREIDLSLSYEPLEALTELDVDKFLDHQHQMLVNTAIEEATKLVRCFPFSLLFLLEFFLIYSNVLLYIFILVFFS